MVKPPTIWTIGHSNHPLERFIELVKSSGVTTVADVRSSPFSRYVDHFNQPVLRRALESEGLTYVFLGHELGGRPNSPAMYDNEGHVLYGEVSRSEIFNTGLKQLISTAGSSNTAMMCSEEDPTDCHRRLLVARVLRDMLIPVTHIRGNGETIGEVELEQRIGSDHQLILFVEEEQEDEWRSAQSVLRNTPPNSSSDH